jgi:hypothetical protein
VEARTKKALTLGAVALGGAAATYGLVIRPWHHKWGAAPIDVKRPMPGDEIVTDPNDITNRAITIEADPEDIWPWLVNQPHDKMREGEVISVGAAGEMRVEHLQKNRAVVLVPERLPHGQASWSIMLEPFASNRTRLLCRTRLHVGWSPREIMYRVALDPAAFLMLRKWFLGVKEHAEQTAMIRRQDAQLERRKQPKREYRPRQQPPGGGTSPTG